MTLASWILLLVFAVAIFFWWNKKRKKIAAGKEAPMKAQFSKWSIDGAINVVGLMLGIAFFKLFGIVGLALAISALIAYNYFHKGK